MQRPVLSYWRGGEDERRSRRYVAAALVLAIACSATVLLGAAALFVVGAGGACALPVAWCLAFAGLWLVDNSDPQPGEHRFYRIALLANLILLLLLTIGTPFGLVLMSDWLIGL